MKKKTLFCPHSLTELPQSCAEAEKVAFRYSKKVKRVLWNQNIHSRAHKSVISPHSQPDECGPQSPSLKSTLILYTFSKHGYCTYSSIPTIEKCLNKLIIVKLNWKLGAVVGTECALRTGRFAVRTPVATNYFFCSKTSTLALGTIQSPIQWVQGSLPGGKAVGACIWPPTSMQSWA